MTNFLIYTSRLGLTLAILINSSVHARSKRSVGGYQGERCRFPFLVDVRKRSECKENHVCGGTILNHRWVLTAAQCVTSSDTGFELSSSDISVWTGIFKSDETSRDSYFVKGYSIKRVIASQDWVKGGFKLHFTGDIALLKTNWRIEFNQCVGVIQPIAFSPEKLMNRYAEYAMVSWPFSPRKA